MHISFGITISLLEVEFKKLIQDKKKEINSRCMKIKLQGCSFQTFYEAKKYCKQSGLHEQIVKLWQLCGIEYALPPTSEQVLPYLPNVFLFHYSPTHLPSSEYKAPPFPCTTLQPPNWSPCFYFYPLQPIVHIAARAGELADWLPR